MYPDFSHFWRMTRSIGTLAKSQSCEILSKQDLMSPSKIHCAFALLSALKHCSIASAQDRCGRNPYEFLSALVSTMGSRAIKYKACIALSFIVGIPSGRIVLPSDFGM